MEMERNGGVKDFWLREGSRKEDKDGNEQSDESGNKKKRKQRAQKISKDEERKEGTKLLFWYMAGIKKMCEFVREWVTQ